VHANETDALLIHICMLILAPKLLYINVRFSARTFNSRGQDVFQNMTVLSQGRIKLKQIKQKKNKNLLKALRLFKTLFKRDNGLVHQDKNKLNAKIVCGLRPVL